MTLILRNLGRQEPAVRGRYCHVLLNYVFCSSCVSPVLSFRSLPSPVCQPCALITCLPSLCSPVPDCFHSPFPSLFSPCAPFVCCQFVLSRTAFQHYFVFLSSLVFTCFLTSDLLTTIFAQRLCTFAFAFFVLSSPLIKPLTLQYASFCVAHLIRPIFLHILLLDVCIPRCGLFVQLVWTEY